MDPLVRVRANTWPTDRKLWASGWGHFVRTVTTLRSALFTEWRPTWRGLDCTPLPVGLVDAARWRVQNGWLHVGRGEWGCAG